MTAHTNANTFHWYDIKLIKPACFTCPLTWSSARRPCLLKGSDIFPFNSRGKTGFPHCQASSCWYSLSRPPPCFNWIVLSPPGCQDNAEVERRVWVTSTSQNITPTPTPRNACPYINPVIMENKWSVGLRRTCPRNRAEWSKTNRVETDSEQYDNGKNVI